MFVGNGPAGGDTGLYGRRYRFPDDNGAVLMRVSGGTEVSTKFASDMNLKSSFIVG
ncbi:hypothetical protein NXX23_09635 [Bacteroides ovatus]|nr:hypothetical protein [Bacteroides ovatus]